MRLPVSLGAVEIFIQGVGIAKIKRNTSIFLKLIAFCVRLLKVLGKFHVCPRLVDIQKTVIKLTITL